ncbi:hypothetical protein ZIOFF_061047 [Zingiber officinale]|uniref:Uncharacterized protein n=1 Tax=Zingiber officinale TaxID=94328 RepID=A0A8J5FBJ0_ZINOF|nr:hypothetical protein ZIOFF_061047 [Zingiber officinale]
MLEVALKYRRVFERMTEEWLPFMNYFSQKDDKGKERIGPPNADDWEISKAFVHFLKKFYDATLELSASKSPTSQLLYQTMIALQVEIDRKRHDDSNPILKEVACAMKLKFDKYWGNWNNINPLIFIGNILDSRNKLQMMKVIVRKLGGTPTSVKEFVDSVKQSLVTLWMEYKGINDILNVESQDMQIECDDGYGSTSGGGGPGGGLCDELFDDVEAQNEEEQLQEISNEVDKYLADEIEKRSNKSFNLLEWWKGSETRYPILSMIAKDVFSIPCSTVASESAFSLGKRIVDPFRSSLSTKMVEALVCTSDWLRAEEFSFWKDPTDDDLELYKEIEEIEKSPLRWITNSDLATCGLGAIQVVATGVITWLTDRAGRRILLIGVFLQESYPYHVMSILSLVGLVAFVVSFSLGLGAIPWIIMLCLRTVVQRKLNLHSESYRQCSNTCELIDAVCGNNDCKFAFELDLWRLKFCYHVLLYEN